MIIMNDYNEEFVCQMGVEQYYNCLNNSLLIKDMLLYALLTGTRIIILLSFRPPIQFNIESPLGRERT